MQVLPPLLLRRSSAMFRFAPHSPRSLYHRSVSFLSEKDLSKIELGDVDVDIVAEDDDPNAGKATWEPHLKTATIDRVRRLPQVLQHVWHCYLFPVELTPQQPIMAIYDMTRKFRDIDVKDEDRKNRLPDMIALGPCPTDVDTLVKAILATCCHNDFRDEENIRKTTDDQVQQIVKPRRPGYLVIDTSFMPFYVPVRKALEQINVPVYLNKEDHIPNLVDIAELATIADNPIYDPKLDLTFRVLTRAEREARYQTVREKYKPENMPSNPYTVAASRYRVPWRELGYSSEEEAINDGIEREEMLDQAQVESLLMEEYDAKTPEEAVWDYAGISRIEVTGDEVVKKLNSNNWMYSGETPRANGYMISEETLSLGQRVLVYKGGAWVEIIPDDEEDGDPRRITSPVGKGGPRGGDERRYT